MSRIFVVSLMLSGIVNPVLLATEANPVSDEIFDDESDTSDSTEIKESFEHCQGKLKSGEIINLQSLTRTDGYARFFTTAGGIWNYTFDPCTAFNEPKVIHEDEHGGDGCFSVLMCVFGVDESNHYYPLGIERTAEFSVVEHPANNTRIQLILEGIKSMRSRKTYINLICDGERVKDDEALFEITKPIGTGSNNNLEANLHHVCCCPDGCPVEVKRPIQAKRLLIVLFVNLGLVFAAVLIGVLCYIKRTHTHIYSKLPGLSILNPNARHDRNKPGIIQNGSRQINRPSPYSDWEPSGSTKKKSLPVLDDSVIPLASLDMGQRLGGGVFGDTHVAMWNGMNVAVKRLTLNVHQNQVTAQMMENMKEEVWKLSRLRNKLIVTVIGLCLDGKMPYIITEHVEGENLRDYIKVKGQQLTWPQRIKICTQIADGVAFLHSSKPVIIHRDVRCGNLFLVDEDVIKVADFGLTKLIQPMREECPQNDCCCMREYSACPAVLRWTAPEILAKPNAQEDGDSVITAACDVYSLGMVMWEVKTGEDPFDDLNTEQEIIDFVVGGGRPDLPNNSELLTQYKDLFRECWCQQPQSRPSAKQVAVKLKEMMQPARAFQKSLKNKQPPKALLPPV